MLTDKTGKMNCCRLCCRPSSQKARGLRPLYRVNIIKIVCLLLFQPFLVEEKSYGALDEPFDTPPFTTDALGNSAGGVGLGRGYFRRPALGYSDLIYWIGTNITPGSLILDFERPFVDGPGADFALLTSSYGWGVQATVATFDFYLNDLPVGTTAHQLLPDRLFQIEIPDRGLVANRVKVTNTTPDPEGINGLGDMAFVDAGVAYSLDNAITIDAPAQAIITQTSPSFPSLAGVSHIFKTGSGELRLSDASRSIRFVSVLEGTLSLEHSNGLNETSIKSSRGGVLQLLGSAVSGAVDLADGGTFRFLGFTQDVLGVSEFVLSGNDSRGQVDVGVGRIEVAAGGIAEADLLQAIIAGRNGGGWDGIDGIMSSAAGPESNRAVGYRVLDSGETIISWAAYGDVNLDGRVSSSDINLIINEGLYGTTQPATWASGDFNYDGRVDVLDMTLLTGTGLFGTGSYLPTGPAPNAAGQSLTAAAVPEPGFGVAALAGLSIAVGMLRARLRRGCLHAAAA